MTAVHIACRALSKVGLRSRYSFICLGQLLIGFSSTVDPFAPSWSVVPSDNVPGRSLSLLSCKAAHENTTFKSSHRSRFGVSNTRKEKYTYEYIRTNIYNSKYCHAKKQYSSDQEISVITRHGFNDHQHLLKYFILHRH